MPVEDSLLKFQAMEKELAQEPGQDGSAETEEAVQPCRQKKKKERIRLVVRNEWLDAYGKLRYELVVGGETFRGRIGEARIIDHLVEPGAKEGALKIWRFEADPRPLVFPLELKKLLPAGVPEGVEQRLTNLGFDCTDMPDEDAPGWERALEALGFEAQIEKATAETLDELYSTRVDGVSPEDSGLWVDTPYAAPKKPKSRMPGGG